VWDWSAKSIYRIAALLPSGTSAVRLPALHASLLTLAVDRARAPHPCRPRFAAKKIGGAKLPFTPPDPVAALALLAALFLSALCGFLRHEFLLGTRLLSSLPATKVLQQVG
jgi:hypothetical protein